MLSLFADSGLWESGKTQLDDIITKMQIQYLQNNNLMYINKEGDNALENYFDASTIKIDMTKNGILCRGDSSTVRIGILQNYGYVAVKLKQFRGSHAEIQNSEKQFIKEIFFYVTQTTKTFFALWATR